MSFSTELLNKNRSKLAAGLLCGYLLVSACSSNTREFTIDHKRAEPVCTGVFLRQIDFDNFTIIPALAGQFLNTDNVVSLVTATKTPAVSSSPTPNSIINTGAASPADFQHGISYDLGINRGSTVPSVLKLYDFQHNDASQAKIVGIPVEVPQITCPAVDLADLVRRNFQMANQQSWVVLGQSTTA